MTHEAKLKQYLADEYPKRGWKCLTRSRVMNQREQFKKYRDEILDRASAVHDDSIANNYAIDYVAVLLNEVLFEVWKIRYELKRAMAVYK